MASSVQGGWTQLSQAALVGTDRQAAIGDAGENPAAPILSSLTVDEPARRLLLHAAVYGPCRRAGRPTVAVVQADLPERCPDETRPTCRPTAANDLARMLGGEFREALPDWLEAVGRRGERVPHEFLPDLLALGRGSKELRPLTLPVIGERGRWLAALNPDWEYATKILGEDAPPTHLNEEVWQTGTREERLAFLRSLRGERPARARELVEETWGQESPAERTTMVAILEQGLSIADEPLLESALDDRLKEVREAALTLLAALPDSTFVRRMEERARPLLSLNKKLLGGDVLEVTLPDACTKEMVRDGIQAKPSQGYGERAWWLLQILSRVPPSFWSRHLGRSSVDLLKANRSKEWSGLVLEGWTRAAQRFQDVAWAERLLETWIARTDGRAPEECQDWTDVLPPETIQRFALRVLESNRGIMQGGHPALSLLRQSGPRWSVELARAVRQRLAELAHLHRDKPYKLWEVAGMFEEWADNIPDLERNAWMAAWREVAQDGSLRASFNRRNDLHRFRREMLARIAAG